MSTGFKILVMLHVLCVIGGFGAVAYNALYLSLAKRRTTGTAAVIEVNQLISGLAELLIYAALIFGIGAVTASNSVIKFSQGWVTGAFGIYLADIAVLHGWIKPQQRRCAMLAARAEAAPAGNRPPEVAELDALERRVALGWGVFNLLVVIAVYLMIFQPGS